MIKCACLLEFNYNTDEILLVRVRDNTKWYLPGGKIELSETPKEALIRELEEELSIKLVQESIVHFITIIDKSLDENQLVELNCFTANYTDKIIPNAEISEVSYLNWKKNSAIIAPAVLTLCKQIFKDNNT